MTILDPQKSGRIRKNNFVEYLDSLGCNDILPLVEYLDFPLSFSDILMLVKPKISSKLPDKPNLRKR
jgi:hypothetical protein